MAIVMELSWKGFTPEQYDDARNRLGWEMPGLLSHVVWFDGGTVHVVDAWESAEAVRALRSGARDAGPRRARWESRATRK